LRTVVKIPVVVHIVWKNAVENISDAQIQSQLDVLNQDFRKKNIDAKDVPSNFKTIAADCEFEFCLAQRDTLGRPTTGITRRQTTMDNIGTAFSNNRRTVYYSDLGGVGNWQPKQYLNIWVCRMESILGFTTSFSKALTTPQEDGIVVDYRTFGTIGTAANNAGHTKGRTATHEIGHYFNLLHIWGTDDTCTDDDLVEDTPKQATAYLGCPSFPQLSCGVSNMYMNFMDYTNDECMGLFTLGQKVRMWAALTEFRSGLLNNNPAVCETSAVQNIDFQWSIYPNPTADVLYLSFKNAALFKDKTVKIMDSFGRVLLDKKGFFTEGGVWALPLTNFPNGLYIVSLKLDNQLFLKKIVVSR
jgi:Pregnancy-associated plasma protein-A/Secretion system C-terminal sorting domain